MDLSVPKTVPSESSSFFIIHGTHTAFSASSLFRPRRFASLRAAGFFCLDSGRS